MNNKKIGLGIGLSIFIIMSIISCGYSLYNKNPYFFTISSLWLSASFIDFILLIIPETKDGEYSINFGVAYIITSSISLISVICSFKIFTYVENNKYVVIWTFFLILISLILTFYNILYFIYYFFRTKTEKIPLI